MVRYLRRHLCKNHRAKSRSIDREKNIRMGQSAFTFIGQVVPQEILNENFDELSSVVDMAGNTFYTALLEGLAENGCAVSAVSRVPQNTEKGKIGRAHV